MGWEHHKRPIDARTGAGTDLRVGQTRSVWTSQAAASTALGPRGIFGLASTSTDETPLVHTLAAPNAGDRLELVIETLATSSSPIHVNAASGYFDNATDGTPATTESANMITLTSAGAGCALVASSSGRWHLIGNSGCTLSTST